ncbi:hypothetical protein GCM10007874_50530 [Labrys miyagiensis]|uniref:Uncharacterized protein n=1 Tax=Labrys miyagiensis TaxID=346912 RepID=A0ABQ6CNY1_9HYPH|nr:hypothetical protein GCM10007874_50530 [Labrys miyagiensis]
MSRHEHDIGGQASAEKGQAKCCGQNQCKWIPLTQTNGDFPNKLTEKVGVRSGNEDISNGMQTHPYRIIF